MENITTNECDPLTIEDKHHMMELMSIFIEYETQKGQMPAAVVLHPRSFSIKITEIEDVKIYYSERIPVDGMCITNKTIDPEHEEEVVDYIALCYLEANIEPTSTLQC